MAAKYFVWGEGVWREVDLASGRVSGWQHRARFVYVRQGRLLVARRRPVLRALEALAAGQPSAAADGPRLSHRSKSESRTKRKHEAPAVVSGLPVTAVAPVAAGTTLPAVAPVAAGPPLPAVAPAPSVPTVPPVAPPACEHHHCCFHRCNYNDERRAAKRTIATQCASGGPSALTFNVKQRHNASDVAAPDYSSAEEFVSTSGRTRRPSLAARTNTQVNELLGKTPASAPPAADKKRAPAATRTPDERRERTRKPARTVASDDTDATSVDEPLQRSAISVRPPPDAACKELMISEADVALLRGYVSRTNASALQRFDLDDSYKRLLFYAINPLVHLERCERLECLLRTASLGLVPARPAPRAARSSSADTDKENKDKHSSPNKVREPVSAAAVKKSREEKPAASEPAPTVRASATRLRVHARRNKLDTEVVVMKAPSSNGVASDPSRARPERGSKKAVLASAAGSCAAAAAGSRLTHVISKRASQPSAKEYSNLEDHAIVAWLSGGSRACLVGGNRVWRELQEQYERLTGRVRSWHSLRNRYLRYILPALGALRLPPADVARLRAAAATGVIKSKNRTAARRHSAFQTPVRGAWSRRPRVRASSDDLAAAADDNAKGPTSPKRSALRPRPPESASKDTSNKDESGNESVSKASSSKEVNSRASISKDSGSKAGKASGSKAADSKAGSSKASGSKEPASPAARWPRYSDVTRQFAARRRPAASPSSSSSSSSRSPSPVLQPSTRLRRLFNPNTYV